MTVDIALVLASGGARGWLERWAPLPEWLVAIGTGALALATYALAKGAKAEVVVAKDTLASTVRPVLTDVPQDWRQLNGSEPQASTRDSWHVGVEPGEAGHVKIKIPVRNVGAGLAFVSGASTRSESDWAPRLGDDWAEGDMASAIVPPGEVEWFFFELPIHSAAEAMSELRRRGAFVVSVTYRDLAGNEWTSKFTVKSRREQDEGWFVAEVLVKVRGAEDEEGVTSGDRDATRLN